MCFLFILPHTCQVKDSPAMDNLRREIFQQTVGQGSTTAELEERILFVLSALEDANEALDKCGRFVGKRVSVQKKSTVGTRVEEPQEKKESPISGTSETHASIGAGESSSKSVRASSSQTTVVSKKASKSARHRKSKSVEPQCPEVEDPKVQNETSPKKSTRHPIATAIVPTQTIPKRQRDYEEKDVTGSHFCKHGTVQTHSCVAPVRTVEISKIIQKFQDNNEMQWKNVRKFIRQVLMSELEQEKFTRKSTETLNAQLTRQNHYLRSKLEEKKLERAKLDETVKRLKKMYAVKLKSLTVQNQHLLKNHSQGAFEKLTRLYTDLERIQSDLHREYHTLTAAETATEDTTQFNTDRSNDQNRCQTHHQRLFQPQPRESSSIQSGFSSRSLVKNVNVYHHPQINHNNIPTTSQHSGTFQSQIFNAHSSIHQSKAARTQPQETPLLQREQEILEQYYPIILDYRRLLETYLTRIALMESQPDENEFSSPSDHQIQEVYLRKQRELREAHQQPSLPSNNNGSAPNSSEESDQDDLLALFVQDCMNALP